MDLSSDAAPEPAIGGVRLDPAGTTPPFEQLRTHVAARVADGTLPAGTKLPTVRALSEQLGVAPGTVARAYRELESDGVIATHGRRGTFVSSAVLSGGASETSAAAETFVADARRAGLTLPEAVRLVEQAWPRTAG